MENDKLEKLTFKQAIESMKTSDDLLMNVEDILALVKVVGTRAAKLETPETRDEIVKSLMSVFSSLDDISSAYLNIVIEAYCVKKDDGTMEIEPGKNATEIATGKVENAEDVLREMNTLMNIVTGVLGVAVEIMTLDDRDEVEEGVKDIFDSIEGIVLMGDHLAAKARDVDIRIKGPGDIEQLFKRVFLLGRMVESMKDRV